MLVNNDFRISISGIILSKQAYQDIAKQLKIFGSSIKLPIDVDVNKIDKTLQNLNVIYDTQGKIIKQTEKYNAGMGFIAESIRKINKEGKLEDIGSKLSFSQSKYNKELKETEKIIQQAEKNKEKIEKEREKALNYEIGLRQKLAKMSEIEINKELKLTKDLELYKQKMQNSLEKLQIGKKTVFSDPQIKKELNKFTTDLNKLGTVGGKSTKELGVQFNTLSTKVAQASDKLRNVNKDGYSFIQMTTLAAKKVAIWTLATSAVYLPISAMREMVRVIVEVDKALIEANKVLDLSQEELRQLSIEATNVGVAYGRTTTEVLRATAAFAKSGLSKEISQDMAKLALLLGNVGDMSVESAQETLIAANAGYQLGNSYNNLIKIIDQMNEISNLNATEVAHMAESWKVSAASAKMAGLSIEEYNSLIGTAQSVTQRSGAEIGNAWKTILMRLQGVADGSDTLEEDLSKAEKALNSIGIAVRKSPTEFRPVMSVLTELSEKLKEISDVEASYVTEALAGKYRANILKNTLQNFDMVNKQMIEALNASGSSMKENANYMEGIEAKTKQFTATWEKLSQTVINSDWIKSIIDFGREFLTIVDRLIKVLGGWNVALIAVNIAAIALASSLIKINTQLAVTGVLSWGNALSKLLPTLTGIIGLLMGTNTQLTIMNALTAGIPLLIGAVTAGIFYYANAQQEAKEKLEATNKAQAEFNKVIGDFQNTLDPNKIQEAANALESLKQATEYDKTIEDIKKLEKEIANLQEQRKNAKYFGDIFHLDDEILYKQEKLNKLIEAEKPNIDKVREAEKKLNEEKEMSIAIDYQSVQSKLRTLTISIQQNDANLKLVESYKDVYDKLRNGIELTKEESELNKKLLDQYPEYTKLLNKKTGALGINYEALKENLTITQSLAIVEFNEAKESARMQLDKTNNLIEQTKQRISAIQVEIDYINKLKTANTGLIDNWAWADTTAGQRLSDAQKRLDQLKLTANAYGTIIGSSPSDWLGGTSGGYIPPSDKDKSGSKSSSPSSLSEALIEKDRYAQLSYEIEKVNVLLEKNKALQENATESQKIKLLNEEIALLKQKQENLHAINEEKRKERTELVGKLSSQGAKFSGEGDSLSILNAQILLEQKLAQVNKHRNDKDKTYYNNLKNQYDDLANAVKRFIELQTKDIPDMSIEWYSLQKAINATQSSLEEINQAQKEFAEDNINSYQDFLIKGIENEIKKLEEKKQALQDTNEELRIEEERKQKLIDLEKQRELLDNLKNERNVRLFQNGEWKWVADPRAVREAEDRLTEMEYDYNQWELEQQRQAEIDAYDDRINALREFIDNSKTEYDEQKAEITSWTELIQSLSGLEQEVYADRLKELKKFIKDWNKLADKMDVATIASGSISKKSSSGSSGVVKAGADGKAPSGLSAGTIVETNGGDYLITDVNDDGSYKSTKIYDKGGSLNPGQTAINLSDKPERILSPEQTKSFDKLISILPNVLSKISIPKFTPINTPTSNDNRIIIENMTVKANNPVEFMKQLNANLGNIIAVRG